MPPSTKPRLLIVEDTPDNIHVLLDTLKNEFAITIAKNGEQALSMVTPEALPDLILLDVMMPGIDGYEVCQRLKRDPQTSDIPVIFITALSAECDEARGLGLGAVDYITKPFAPELVRARVRNQLHLHVARQRVEAQAAQLRQYNQDLQHTVRELKLLHEQRSELLGMAVHDLKNPLSAISGIASLLTMPSPGKMDEARRQHLLQTITRSTDHMLEIVNNMLAFEQLESGRVELNREPRDLADFAQMVVDLNQPIAVRKEIELEAELGHGCTASVDGPKIREAMDNLVSNAIKFSPQGKHVAVHLQQHNGHVSFTVKDEGPGLTEADREKLFGRFQKLSARPTGGESSTGLGLSITKRLVELHGGTIGVESEPGSGAAFTIQLPGVSP